MYCSISNNTSVDSTAKTISEQDSVFICNVCMEPLKDCDPVLTTCGHLYCWACLHQWLNKANKDTCPVCSSLLQVDKNVIPVFINTDGETSSDNESNAEGIPNRPSVRRVLAEEADNEEEEEEVAHAKRLVAKLCNMSDTTAQTDALEELADVDYVWSCTEALYDCGVVLPLIGLLAGSNTDFKLSAAIAIGNIAQEEEYRVPIFQTGVVPMLVRLLDNCGDDCETQAAAVTAIAAIADDDSNLVPVHNTGVVPHLVNLLSSEELKVQLAAASAIKILSKADGNKLSICQTMASESLIDLLTDNEVDDSVVEEALYTILSLCSDPRTISYFIEAGAILPLVELLNSDGYAAPTLAAEILSIFASHSDDNRVSIHEAGATPALIEMLKHGEDAEQVATSKAIMALSCVEAHKLYLFHNGAIAPLMKVLTHGCRQVLRFAAGAIGNIASANSIEVWNAIMENVKLPLKTLLMRDDEEIKLRTLEIIEVIAQSLPPHLASQFVETDILNSIVDLTKQYTKVEDDEEADGAKNEIRLALTKLLSAIATTDETRKCLIDAGIIQPLLDIIRSDNESVQRQVALVIKSFADCASSRDAIKAADAMSVLSDLFESSRSKEVKAAIDDVIDAITTDSFGVDSQISLPMEILDDSEIFSPKKHQASIVARSRSGSFNLSMVVGECLQEYEQRHSLDKDAIMGSPSRGSRRQSFSRSRSGSFSLGRAIGESLVEHHDRH